MLVVFMGRNSICWLFTDYIFASDKIMPKPEGSVNGEILGLALIFIARVADVSIGTFRIILMSRGHRGIAPILGFFEVLIWITAVGHVLNNLNGPVSYVCYAAGFATGNYTGMLLESLISVGYQSVRIITSEKVTALPLVLRQEGFGITTVKGRGMKGDVNLIYTMTARSRLKKIMEIVETMEPGAFVTIEDVRTHQSGFVAKSIYPFGPGRGLVKKK